MKILGIAKTLALTTLITAGASGVNKIYAQNSIVSPQEITELADTFVRSVPPEGTDDIRILKNAPSPLVEIAGEYKKSTIVVDADNHILYLYDDEGNPVKAYLVATGKKGLLSKDGKVIRTGTPTKEGVCVVSHVEKYPYKSAPVNTKRHRTPKAFGPSAIILEKVNTETGKTGPTGQFIHGNGNKSSLGKNASLGCIRMDNNAVKYEVAPFMKRGMIINIINSSKY